MTIVQGYVLLHMIKQLSLLRLGVIKQHKSQHRSLFIDREQI